MRRVKLNTNVGYTGPGGRLTTAGFTYFYAIEEIQDALIDSVHLPSYTVATLPSAADNWGTDFAGLVYVSNASGGAITAFSDGTNWRRTSDRSVIS